MTRIKGSSVTCTSCGGHGLVASWSEGANWPDECEDCGGSGQNWRYPNGMVARYYSGPFVGRDAPRDSDAMLGTKPEGLSPEGVAARAAESGIAQITLQPLDNTDQPA